MKELTKAEEQIMQILWDLKKGFVKDILERLPDPKPAYNTVSTIVRILQDFFHKSRYVIKGGKSGFRCCVVYCQVKMEKGGTNR